MKVGPRLLSVAVAAALAGCGDDMNQQPRLDRYGAATLFRDGKVMQAPPDGTVSRDWVAATRPSRERPPLTADLLRRGQERYAIFCSPCHDLSGHGQGIVPSRGYPRPPSYHEPRLRDASSRYVFDVITNGYGVMYSYASRVPPDDRWAIAAYVRALQVSQGAKATGLPEADRTRLPRPAGPARPDPATSEPRG